MQTALDQPGSIRRHGQPGQRQKNLVVVDAPSGKISPGLLAVFLEPDTSSQQGFHAPVVVLPGEADRLHWIVRVTFVWITKIIGNVPQG